MDSTLKELLVGLVQKKASFWHDNAKSSIKKKIRHVLVWCGSKSHVHTADNKQVYLIYIVTWVYFRRRGRSLIYRYILSPKWNPYILLGNYRQVTREFSLLVHETNPKSMYEHLVIK